MDVFARSLPTAVSAVVSAAVVVLTPSATPTLATTADPAALRLTSAAQLPGPDLPDPTPAVLTPAPDEVTAAVLTAGSVGADIGADIEAFYNAVEPWMAYGVNLESWAVGWVPLAGLLAPQLLFFYDLDEPILQSLVFNTADLLSGTVDLAQALNNVGTAATDAFDTFATTEADWVNSLLPPAPPAAVDPGGLADIGALFGLLP
ncbi:hypothetical protein [Mycobacterium sp.]|uniref:hypothetical protein n=1 Tax=Mycobacterium sp. TaxID=1785 RepID=UPI0012772B17|nr:hypothetical protein [Mycobacterium sp.]KAA8969235.1 MAG: hypothetical protein F6Q13_03840 [Mycobacterium sp.]